MKTYLNFILLSLCFLANTYAQKKQYLLAGIVKDYETKEPIESVTVYLSGLNVTAQTTNTGEFAFSLPATKNYQLTFRLLGYKLKIQSINLLQDVSIEVYLQKTEKLLDEVVITTEKADANIQRTLMGVEKMSGKTLKKLPNLMGESDVIRSIMLLPGVSTVGEGASGFNVRGGNVDQNLVLLDGVLLFNTSHLLGFFTGFNADMVQEASLYKSGIPANYGGRASSVLDVRLKEGNTEKWQGQGGIGVLSSKIMIEGPIFKDKTSIILGVRGSLSDFYLRFFQNPNLQKSEANFYDLNAKIVHRFGKNQRISLAAYNSYDNFKFSQDTSYYWKTQNLSFKHNALISAKFSHNLTAFISHYAYGVKGLSPTFGYSWQPSISQKGVREDLSYELASAHHLDFGGEINFYQNNAGSLLPDGVGSIIQPLFMPIEHSREMGIYANVNSQLSPKISIDYGIRYSNYGLLGAYNQLNYAPEKPREISTIIDTVNYSKNKLVKKYGGFEPRLSIAFKLDSSFSIKVGYNRMQQYMHLLSNTMAISPTDIWKNSNAYIPQQVVNQFSIGIFRNFKDSEQRIFESSIEMYYKQLGNVIDYIDGASLYLNPTIETQLLIGKGMAYGAEFYLKKPKGKHLTGWFSYSYARTFRQVEATQNQLAANFGLRFPANFDTPHTIKAVLNERLTKRISFNANLTYNTGRPITFPNGRYKIYAFNDLHDYLVANGLNPRNGLIKKTYIYNGQTYVFLENGTITEILDGYATPSFTLRNAERIPDYLRLDVGFTLAANEQKAWRSSWNFSIYNLLSRENVYSIYFKSSTGLRNLARTYQLSILGAAIPSLTYNFEF